MQPVGYSTLLVLGLVGLGLVLELGFGRLRISDVQGIIFKTKVVSYLVSSRCFLKSIVGYLAHHWSQ